MVWQNWSLGNPFPYVPIYEHLNRFSSDKSGQNWKKNRHEYLLVEPLQKVQAY